MSAVALLTACQNNNSDNKKNTSEGLEQEYEYGTDISPMAPLSSEPTTKYAKVLGWEEDNSPKSIDGFKIIRFANDLNSPRNIYVAPNGDIFVAQARTEREGEEEEKVNSRNVYKDKSPNEILRFIDTNQDGRPDKKEVFLSGLSQPFGMLVLNDYFYVANTDGLVRFPYDQNSGKVQNTPEKLLDLPAGGYNNHWTRNLTANEDGSKIYISVGSGSNVGENGMEHEVRRAAILEINPDGSDEKIYAAGIRNPVGMDWEPTTKTLWTVVNERDQLGDELVPDYATSVKKDGFYGWPYYYWGKHVDPRWEDKIPDSIPQNSITPDYALGAHTASLGLAFNKAAGFDEGLYIGQHGSWNKSSFTGYKIIFVPFKNGKPAGKPQDFVTGFIADEPKNEVYGRPVDVEFTGKYLLISDDAANTIWAVLPE